MDSLWNFESAEANGEYQMPKHNSENFIDIDFTRELLFIDIKDSQRGIEDLHILAQSLKKLRMTLLETLIQTLTFKK